MIIEDIKKYLNGKKNAWKNDDYRKLGAFLTEVKSTIDYFGNLGTVIRKEGWGRAWKLEKDFTRYHFLSLIEECENIEPNLVPLPEIPESVKKKYIAGNRILAL